MSCFWPFEDKEFALSESKYRECLNGPIKKLQKACKNFTSHNISRLDEDQAKSWIILFQLHFSHLEDNDLTAAFDNFESVFEGKKTRVLFLNRLSSQCENNIPLLERACALMTKDALRSVNRKIIVQWAAIIERNWDCLCKITMGVAVRNIHEVHQLKPHELKQFVTLKGSDNQEHQFPLLLLLTYEVFQGVLSRNNSITFEKTSIVVLQRFEEYLWQNKFPKCNMLPFFWDQLLTIAREIEDERLIATCHEKIKIYQENEYNFIQYSASGKELLAKGRYKQAIQHFEKASQSPFFKDELAFCQALLGCLNENGEEDFDELLFQAEKWLKRNGEEIEEHYFLCAEIACAKQDIEEMERALTMLEFRFERVDEVRFWNLQEKLHIAKGEIKIQPEEALKPFDSKNYIIAYNKMLEEALSNQRY